MIDQWLSDPGKLSATALLIAAIWVMFKGLVITRQLHDAILERIALSYRDVILRLEADLVRERAEKLEFKSMVLRNLEVTDKALQTAEKAHQLRAEVYRHKRSEDEEPLA